MAKVCTLIVIFFVCVWSADCFSNNRSRRDLTCSAGGHRLCRYICMGRGRKDGKCVWDTTLGSYDCICDSEKRGVRCHVGGSSVCHLSCLAIGYQNGDCDASFNCTCSGQSRWGQMIEDFKNTL